MRSEHVLEIDESNFAQVVTASPVPVLVDFSAVWCAPCRALAPHLDAVAQSRAGQLRVGVCDVDANPALAARFEVRSMPTLLLYRDGVVFGQMVGAAPRTRLEAWLDGALATRGAAAQAGPIPSALLR